MPLKVSIDEHSGFCFGVINAIRTAENYLEKHRSLYCLGDIVHNSEEVKRLSGLGLKIITHEKFSILKDTTVLIRAHGEPPEIYDIAKKNNIELIDATCPVVLRLQKRISDVYQKSRSRKQILIFGKKGHAEVVGLLGQTENNGIVIASTDDLQAVDFSKPSIIYSQTTQNLDQYYELVDVVRRRYEEAGKGASLEFEDTICRKVSSRARQIAEFAKKHDLVIFVTGEKSSNGLYLSSVCLQNNPRTFIISSVSQLGDVDFSGIETVGICGATSTPMWLMEQIAAKCSDFSENNG